MINKKILIEAGPMVSQNRSGVGHYVEGFIRSLVGENKQGYDITAYYFNFLSLNEDHVPKIDNLSIHKIWLIPGKLLSIFRRLGFQPFLDLFTLKRSDMVIFTNYVALPLLSPRRKIGLVIYDMSFLDAATYMQDINLKFLKRFCSKSITKADLIITISEFTKSRILHYFPDLKAKIVVTPIPPISPARSKADLPKKLQKMGIEKDSYILYVGTIEPRKNIQNLVKAYSNLDPAIRNKYSLVLAGGKGWKDEGILKEIALQKKKGLSVITTGYISDSEKAALYKNATCLAFASHYEGFGMPLVEAMQYSLPIAASDIQVHREAAGEAALYFNKDDTHDITEKLAQMLSNKKLRTKLANEGSKQLKKYSWKDNADLVLSELDSLLK